ncbi:MAG: hypothetical protein EB168_04485 [Euryarchaeota archaeon]|nr:hypothetical protein [Euryarchaeota archaeon]
MELVFIVKRMANGNCEMTAKMERPLESLDAVVEWNHRMGMVADEIDDLPHCTKQSYGKWIWSNSHELNRWLTYYHLRFSKDPRQDGHA